MSRVSVREHDGKVCYRLRPTHPVPGDRQKLVRIGRQDVVALESIYSGMWYLFDAKTGDEIGSIRRRCFEDVAVDLGDLVADPDC